MNIVCPCCGEKFKYTKPKKKKELKVFTEETTEYQLSQYLKGFILQNNSKAKIPSDLNKWSIEFDRMLRLDEREPNDIYQVMKFAHSNTFWQSNILSASSVRRNFDKLYLQMKNENKKPKNNFEKMMENIDEVIL